MQKQLNKLKNSLLSKKNTNTTGEQLKILWIKNAEFLGYYFCMN